MMRDSDLQRRATEAAFAGDLHRAAAMLEQIANPSSTSHRTLSSIYRRLAHGAPDPRTRLRLDPAPDDSEGWWEWQWQRARRITNEAWRIYETADSVAELRHALRGVRTALEVWPHLVPLRETEARILVRLGREEEAFEIARWVEAFEPGADLTDLRASAAYRVWTERRDTLDVLAAA